MTDISQHVTAAFDRIEEVQPDAIQMGLIQQPAAVTGGGPADPTGGTVGVLPDPISARMAVFEIDEKRVDGTNIRFGDYQCIVEPIGVEITVSDKVSCSFGEAMTIVRLGKVASGGETALYDMVIRG